MSSDGRGRKPPPPPPPPPPGGGRSRGARPPALPLRAAGFAEDQRTVARAAPLAEEDRTLRRPNPLVAAQAAPNPNAPRYRTKGMRWRHPLGEVFDAVDGQTGDRVVLTLLHPARKLAQGHLDAARATANVLSGVVDAAINGVVDIVPYPDGRVAVVTEYLNATALSEQLGRKALPPARVFAILRQVTRAIGLAHRAGVAHGALCVGSVLLTGAQGKPDTVVLTDFAMQGLVGADLAIPDTDAGYHPVTPERILGLTRTEREDLYLVGCLGYTMLTGSPPFRTGNALAVQRRHAIEDPMPIPERLRSKRLPPAALIEVVHRCLSKEAEDRFEDANDLEAELCLAQIDAGVQTPWDDLPIPRVDEARRQTILRGMQSRRAAARPLGAPAAVDIAESRPITVQEAEQLAAATEAKAGPTPVHRPRPPAPPPGVPQPIGGAVGTRPLQIPRPSPPRPAPTPKQSTAPLKVKPAGTRTPAPPPAPALGQSFPVSQAPADDSQPIRIPPPPPGGFEEQVTLPSSRAFPRPAHMKPAIKAEISPGVPKPVQPDATAPVVKRGVVGRGGFTRPEPAKPPVRYAPAASTASPAPTPPAPKAPVPAPSPASLQTQVTRRPAAPSIPAPPLAKPAAPSIPAPPLAKPAAPSIPAPPLAKPAAPSIPAPPLAKPAAPSIPAPPLAEPAAPPIHAPPSYAKPAAPALADPAVPTPIATPPLTAPVAQPLAQPAAPIATSPLDAPVAQPLAQPATPPLEAPVAQRLAAPLAPDPAPPLETPPADAAAPAASSPVEAAPTTNAAPPAALAGAPAFEAPAPPAPQPVPVAPSPAAAASFDGGATFDDDLDDLLPPKKPWGLWLGIAAGVLVVGGGLAMLAGGSEKPEPQAAASVTPPAQVTPESKPEPEPEPEPEPDDSEPVEVTDEPEPEPEPEPRAKTNAKANTPRTQRKPKAEPASKPKAKPASKPKPPRSSSPVPSGGGGASASELASKGNDAFNKAQYKQAAGFLEKAVKKAPGNAKYRLLLGDTYFKQGRFSKARKQYVEADELGVASAKRRIEKVDAKLGG